ncbi:MAG: hypothetical protein H0Z24_06860 [Thermosipho sp. (in: Bacteria)]|nr:hypothetical protein [Thermosipho sp. (in: thermotogales)]
MLNAFKILERKRKSFPKLKFSPEIEKMLMRNALTNLRNKQISAQKPIQRPVNNMSQNISRKPPIQKPINDKPAPISDTKQPIVRQPIQPPRRNMPIRKPIEKPKPIRYPIGLPIQQPINDKPIEKPKTPIRHIPTTPIRMKLPNNKIISYKLPKTQQNLQKPINPIILDVLLNLSNKQKARLSNPVTLDPREWRGFNVYKQ